MIEVVTLGETMALVRTDPHSSNLYGSEATIGFGGADSNVAIGLARLGHSVRWISSLGADAFGTMITSKIAEQGVDVHVDYSDVRQTGLMVKSPSSSTERFVSFYRAGSAASAMGPDRIDEKMLAGAKILHVTGITPALSSSCLQLVRSSVQLAKNLGAKVSFDVNFRPALWREEIASPLYRELATEADFVFGDLRELAMLVDGYNDIADLLRQVAAMGPGIVVLKEGESGATAIAAGEIYSQPAFEVEVLDTVGAGDGFVAGFLSGQLDAASVQESLFRATFCGAQVCTDLGDWEGAPGRHELELARRELVS